MSVRTIFSRDEVLKLMTDACREGQALAGRRDPHVLPEQMGRLLQHYEHDPVIVLLHEQRFVSRGG